MTKRGHRKRKDRPRKRGRGKRAEEQQEDTVSKNVTVWLNLSMAQAWLNGSTEPSFPADQMTAALLGTQTRGKKDIPASFNVKSLKRWLGGDAGMFRYVEKRIQGAVKAAERPE